MTTAARRHKSKKKKAGKPGISPWLIVTIMTPVAIFAMPTTLLLVAGMVPTVIAWIVDRDPEKYAPMTVGALNFCGILPFLLDLWKHQHTVLAATRTLADPLTWMIMLGAAGVGWVIYYSVPPMVVSFELARSQRRIEAQNTRKKDLVEEWGVEVTMDDETLIKHQQARNDARAEAARG